MIANKTFNTSIAMSLWRYFYSLDARFKQNVKSIYHQSRAYQFFINFWPKMKLYFKNSFLGRITDIETEACQNRFAVWDNSRAIKYARDIFKRCKEKIVYFFHASFAGTLAKEIKKEFYSSPIKSISLVVLTAITMELGLSVFASREIAKWSLFVRILFLLAAFFGSICETKWETLKKTSILQGKL